ncbi:MAG: TetR/AcrR family transcriptional regulator [Myxococcales bacterium]|nr:TetR/AcrR family transcriptional regulator [Myxococcales bacterium]
MARPAGRSSEETRSSLLEAAARLFADKGYAGASIREIADAAHLQSAMIAYYFKNKAGLYDAVIEQMYERMQVAIGENVGQAPHLMRDLDRAAELVWDFARQNQGAMRIMIRHALDIDPSMRPSGVTKRFTMSRMVSQQLAAVGQIAYEEARTMLVTINYYLTRLIAEREADLRETFELEPDDDFDAAMVRELARFLRLVLRPILPD